MYDDEVVELDWRHVPVMVREARALAHMRILERKLYKLWVTDFAEPIVRGLANIQK